MAPLFPYQLTPSALPATSIPYSTPTLIWRPTYGDEEWLSETLRQLEKQCTPFSHPYPSPVPTKREQRLTSILLRRALPEQAGIMMDDGQPIQCYYERRAVYRTLIFIISEYDGEQEFTLTNMEEVARCFVRNWLFDTRNPNGSLYRARQRPHDQHRVWLGIAVGTRMRFWRCERFVGREGLVRDGVDFKPVWGSEDVGDWKEYLEMGDAVEGARLMEEWNKMLVENHLPRFEVQRPWSPFLPRSVAPA